MNQEILKPLIYKNKTKIIYIIMDGLGGLPREHCGNTELETAKTPNMDAWARTGTLGLLDPIGHGITPGSGPAHLALFGYDPVPVLLHRGRGLARIDKLTSFGEAECSHGGLGRMPMRYIILEALAMAGRLHKFGA